MLQKWLNLCDVTEVGANGGLNMVPSGRRARSTVYSAEKMLEGRLIYDTGSEVGGKG